MGYQRTFSHLALGTILLAGLSGCTWLIPDDPSTLRYNSVLGERHAPVGNQSSAINKPLPEEETGMAVMTETNTTPVAPMVQAQAPTVVSAAPTPMVQVMPQAPAMRPQPLMQGLPPVDALTQSRAERELARQTPTENAMYDVAQNNAFTSVPPSPVAVGADAPAARLQNVRRDLEAERARADAARDQLSRDVQAEPSMLPNTGRPQDPAMINAPVNDKGAVLPPEAAMAPTGYVALPPPPPLGMPPQQPEMIAPAPMIASVPADMGYAPAPMVPGGFDPMAVRTAPAAAPSVAYASTTGYMQPSRYKR